MSPAEIKKRTTEWLATASAQDILIKLPADSGICSIASVSADKWISGFISTREGRWNIDGQPTKYYASDLETCAAELFGTDKTKLAECVCERWHTTAEVLAFDVSKFPQDLRDAFYDDKGVAPDKWIKPHIFISTAAANPSYTGVNAIYAPSASGIELGLAGVVFAANPETHGLKLQQTGLFQEMIK